MTVLIASLRDLKMHHGTEEKTVNIICKTQEPVLSHNHRLNL